MDQGHHSAVDISFVILTWNSQSFIERCVLSYAAAMEKERLRAEFLIVENGSQDKTLDILENTVRPRLPDFCRLEIIKLPGNAGTTKSRNLALRKVAGRFCVVCDSDTEFLRGSWKDALRFLESDPQIGIIAAHLFNEDKTTQQSVRRFPTLPDKLLKLRKTFLAMPESITDHYDGFPWPSSREVDTAISAFWMFRSTLRKEVGLLDENIFYSPEDLDFCLRVWESGKKVMYYPHLEILHKMRRISHANPFSYIAISHLWGLLYYYKKHHYWISRKKLYKRLKKLT